MIRPSDLERFISDFEDRLAPVERAADEAWWNLATSGTDMAREEFVAAGKAYNDLFSDTDEYGRLRGQTGSARDTLDFEIWWRNLTIDLSPGAGAEVKDGTGESTIQWAGRGEFYRVISGSGDDTIDAKDGFPNAINCGEGADTVSFDTELDTVISCENSSTG